MPRLETKEDLLRFFGYGYLSLQIQKLCPDRERGASNRVCVQWFYSILCGRSGIIVETNHSPLLSIFNKPLIKCPKRLQNMILTPAIQHDWEFKHITSSPHYPQRNEKAEVSVRLAKDKTSTICYCCKEIHPTRPTSAQPKEWNERFMKSCVPELAMIIEARLDGCALVPQTAVSSGQSSSNQVSSLVHENGVIESE
ncbi:hypothetical protein J6590_059608 [Homalodisca vitripennis]|nr:hypothetical protein J6590_059608 [Homalodisca vitripennis]